MAAPARVLVAGAGSAGRRHLRNLRALLPSAHLICWRMSREGHDEELSSLADDVAFDQAAAFAGRPEAAIVAGPATTHAPVAVACLERGLPVLIEKPISHRLDEAERIAAVAAAAQLPVVVGYMLRFHPLLVRVKQELAAGQVGRIMSVDAEVGQSLTEWRPTRPYQSTVSAQAALGGGVLLELSHEFDYLAWLLGPIEHVGALAATVSGLELDVEDCAALAVRFASGVLGTLSMDLVRRPMRRGCRMHGVDGTLELDLVGHRLRVGRPGGGWETLVALSAFDRNDLFMAELRHFLRCIDGSDQPAVTIADGMHALAVAAAATRSAAEGRFVDV